MRILPFPLFLCWGCRTKVCYAVCIYVPHLRQGPVAGPRPLENVYSGVRCRTFRILCIDFSRLFSYLSLFLSLPAIVDHCSSLFFFSFFFLLSFSLFLLWLFASVDLKFCLRYHLFHSSYFLMSLMMPFI